MVLIYKTNVPNKSFLPAGPRIVFFCLCRPGKDLSSRNISHWPSFSYLFLFLICWAPCSCLFGPAGVVTGGANLRSADRLCYRPLSYRNQLSACNQMELRETLSFILEPKHLSASGKGNSIRWQEFFYWFQNGKGKKATYVCINITMVEDVFPRQIGTRKQERNLYLEGSSFMMEVRNRTSSGQRIQKPKWRFRSYILRNTILGYKNFFSWSSFSYQEFLSQMSKGRKVS